MRNLHNIICNLIIIIIIIDELAGPVLWSQISGNTFRLMISAGLLPVSYPHNIWLHVSKLYHQVNTL